MSNAPIYLNLRLRLIQQWRMLQAVVETGLSFSLSEDHRINVEHLQRYFDFPISFEPGVRAPADLMSLSTDDPWSEIAGMRRVLIYSHQQLDLCRAGWRDDRTVEYGFSGFDHRSRHDTLEAWHQRWFGTPAEPQRLRNSDLLANYGGDDPERHKVVIAYVKTGRRFPEKVWDEPYYNFLSNSRFTLCPDGEEIWTYRFFEAIMCGSVPVVQSECSAYEGFYYGRMDQALEDLACDRRTIEANFSACRGLLTLPTDELRASLMRMLKE